MKRAINTRTAFSKTFVRFDFKGVWKDVFGRAIRYGVWIIYGPEKNGKSWFAIMLADYLSTFDKVLYISAEEGMDGEFVEAIKRAGVAPDNTALLWQEYVPLDELYEILERRQAPRVVFVDNVTVYKDELSYGGFQKLWKAFPKTLFVFVAHEERNEPYTATAKMIKRLSKIIIRIQGLTCFISGRCPGGTLMIDEGKSKLYHGNDIADND